LSVFDEVQGNDGPRTPNDAVIPIVKPLKNFETKRRMQLRHRATPATSGREKILETTPSQPIPLPAPGKSPPLSQTV
jgi:hypothetical protein